MPHVRTRRLGDRGSNEKMRNIAYFCLLFCCFANGNTDQDVYWRDYVDGHVPDDALPAGYGLYIGQMPLNGILPGTIYPQKKSMLTECCSGRKEASEGIKILCTKHPENFRWKYINIASVTAENVDDLVRGGIEKGNVLYIGRVFYEGEWRIGKVYPATHKLRGLRIWTFNGGLHVANDFQILKYVAKANDK